MPGIREWLSSHGLSEYADRFAENRIDLSILPDLTDDDLKELRVITGGSSTNFAFDCRAYSQAASPRYARVTPA